MRRSIENKKEAEKIRLKLQEIEDKAVASEQEEKEEMEKARIEIDGICERHQVFCGAILTTENVLQLVHAAITQNENIRIPYNLYFLDTP